MKEHGDMVLRTVYLITRNLEASEEITQDVFVRAYRKLHTFRAECSERTWLYRIACNLARNHKRIRPERRGAGPVTDFDRQAAKHPGPEDRLLRGETRVEVVTEVGRLPADLREVVALHYLTEMSVDETAETLGIPAGTVKSRLSRARDQLREALTSEAEEAGIAYD
jgi:RNA polymerase sigma-70 factor (ECF subfamily)